MPELGIRLFKFRILFDPEKESSEIATPFDYSIAQKKVLYYRKTLLEALRFKKYYAHKVKRCQLRIPGEGEQDSGVNAKTIPG